jgi:hypothetical protein
MPEFVHAEPTKHFFIDEITKDISLLDCILDLLDNCIDGAERTLEKNPPKDEDARYSGFSVTISFDQKKFRILDNCGGLSKKDTISTAFSFGREGTKDDGFSKLSPQKSIGLYGIGMKRAIFKIGKKAVFESKRKNEAFCVDIDVPKWKKDKKNWTFPIDDLPLKFPDGVSIQISDLYENISNQFDLKSFENDLRRVVSRDYYFFIKSGLNIKINAKRVDAQPFTFKSGSGFTPVNFSFKDKVHKNVEITIKAGVAAAPPDDASDPEIIIDKAETYGWYVVCNDRVVLAANRDERTIWKGRPEFTAWHSQYNGFMGFVFFKTDHPELLPWTTTKREIDSSSELYKRIIPYMENTTAPWTEYTAKRKADLDAAKDKESKAKSISLNAIPVSKNQLVLGLPALAAPTAATANPAVTITYSVDAAKKKKVAKALGNASMSNKEVGLETFKYFWDNEIV